MTFTQPISLVNEYEVRLKYSRKGNYETGKPKKEKTEIEWLAAILPRCFFLWATSAWLVWVTQQQWKKWNRKAKTRKREIEWLFKNVPHCQHRLVWVTQHIFPTTPHQKREIFLMTWNAKTALIRKIFLWPFIYQLLLISWMIITVYVYVTTQTQDLLRCQILVQVCVYHGGKTLQNYTPTAA